MSGFCGWFGADRTSDPRGTLERMTRALPHYGLIETSATSGANFGLALTSHPATGAFAAEADIFAAIEGYPEWRDGGLREIAKTQGHAHALLAAYRSKGSALFDTLRGTFSFAVIDNSTQRAFLAIDRFGIQTLCYAQPHPDLLVFGSTTDAVRAHPAVGSTIRLQSIFDYFYFVDRVPAPTTIYREQQKLTPGEYILAEAGRVTNVKSYWYMPYRSAPIAKEAAMEELKTRLHEAVVASLVGEDVDRVGAFLSGGLDSSSVVGAAAGLMSRKLQTFTIGFPIDGYDEAQYADIAAKHFGTQHQTYYVKPDDVIDIFLKSVQIYDEPFANSSLIPAYHCARLAKEAGVEMLLAGDGGDELFAGNKRYADDAVFDRYAKLPRALRKAVLEPLASHLAVIRDARLLGKGVRYIERAQKTVLERLADNMFQAVSPSAVFSAEALREINVTEPLALATSIYNTPTEASKIQRMMNLDLRVTLADSDLRKVARMCELAGVRTRFPFLNDDLAEFSASLPETLLMEGGKLRQFYKDAMRGFLPDAIIAKQKHGFGLPSMVFMNSHPPLRDLVCDSLTNLKGCGYFLPQFLDDMTARARGGTLSGHENAAWDLVVLDRWLESRK
jgi:asparagine synthase (glutamine-hydrolysing)